MKVDIELKCLILKSQSEGRLLQASILQIRKTVRNQFETSDSEFAEHDYTEFQSASQQLGEESTSKSPEPQHGLDKDPKLATYCKLRRGSQAGKEV